MTRLAILDTETRPLNLNGVGTRRSFSVHVPQVGSSETFPPNDLLRKPTATHTDLGKLGDSSVARSINNTGQVVGDSWLGGSAGIGATIFDGIPPTLLTTLDVGSSEAFGINDTGQIVGLSPFVGFTEYHATLWDSGGTPTDLGTLGESSVARSINSVGQIVGDSYPIGSNLSHATLWYSGSIFDLNTLLDGSGLNWVITLALAINSSGQIAAYGYNPNVGYRGLLLTLCEDDNCITAPPSEVPLPAALPLFAAGLGAIGFMGWRRRKAAEAA